MKKITLEITAPDSALHGMTIEEFRALLIRDFGDTMDSAFPGSALKVEVEDVP